MESRINGVNKVTIASASFTNYYDKTEIDELLGAKQQLYMTQEEYNNLSDEEKLNDNVVFNITDAVTEYPTIEQVNALVSNKADIHHTHNDYATISYVNEAISNVEVGGPIDLSEYAKIDHEHDNYALINHNHDNYALTSHNHNNYALINHNHNNYAPIVHEHNDYLTAIPDEYITNEELEAKNYVTNEELETKDYVTNAVFNATIGDIDSILDFINGEII